MPDIIIRTDEGKDPQFASPWDTLPPENLEDSDGGFDWKVADPAVELQNVGGLQAQNPLSTAVWLCLDIDRRKPDWLGEDQKTQRGWHGDTFDIDVAAGERPLGSLLWTVERAALTVDTEIKAKHYCDEALQTLVDQNVISRFSVVVETDKLAGMLKIGVSLWGPDGKKIFQNNFPLLLS